MEAFEVDDELYAFAGQGVECQGIVGSNKIGAQLAHGYMVECLSVLGAALPDGLALRCQMAWQMSSFSNR